MRILFALGATTTLAALSSNAAGQDDDRFKEAREIYAERCASCHGRDLSGGSAQSMLDGVWQFGGRDSDLTRNIKFGISAVGMPDYGAAK